MTIVNIIGEKVSRKGFKGVAAFTRTGMSNRGVDEILVRERIDSNGKKIKDVLLRRGDFCRIFPGTTFMLNKEEYQFCT